MSDTSPSEKKPKSPLREMVQPFIDFARAPRALWGINLAYIIEGTVYFGMLNYLHMYFNEYVHLDDVWANRMVGVLTAGITFSMFILGFVADKWGVRFAIISAFTLMLGGRTLLSLGPTLGLPSEGMGSALHLTAMGGILLILIGYGMYQPGAYTAVRKFTTAKTAPMGFAMLYALMNLGIVATAGFGPIRNAIGISGAYWVFVGLTVVALALTLAILSRKTVERAIAEAKAVREREQEKSSADKPAEDKGSEPADGDVAEAAGSSIWQWLKNHPLANAKFSFFIFCLIPVQTLFAHQWLTMPMYVERGFADGWPWISKYFELALALNPILVFIFVPTVTALTQKRSVYNMMIVGTLVMAAPTFLLVLGPSPWTLFSYILLMTLGESMWQPRFLQYAAEIAPEGRTGVYMGVAQLPWFLTKMLVPIYAGVFLQRYCPQDGETNTQMMWLIYACIAMTSTVMLIMAKGWIGKDFKTKHDG
ncbi:MAG: MFS transporter [Planctomycetota bacterium]